MKASLSAVGRSCWVITLLLMAPGCGGDQAGQVKCSPLCREGYICIQGECFLNCNPPCASWEACADGLCVVIDSGDPTEDQEFQGSIQGSIQVSQAPPQDISDVSTVHEGQPLALVEIVPPEAEVNAELTLSFTASIITFSPGLEGITFEINGIAGGDPEVGTITADGVYQAPSLPPQAPVVTVTARASSRPELFADANLKILPPIEVSAISPQRAHLNRGMSILFRATALNALDDTLIWSVNDAVGGGEGTGTITSQGLYTAPQEEHGLDQVVVRAASKLAPEKWAEAVIELKPEISVTLFPASAQVQAGLGTQLFTATVENTPFEDVIWSVNGVIGGNEVNGTIDPWGTYHVPAMVPVARTVFIQATSAYDPTRMAEASVTIGPHIEVSITPSSLILETGQVGELLAFVKNTDVEGVIWSMRSSHGSLQANGMRASFLAPERVPFPATLTIEARSILDPNQAATATVIIVEPVRVLALEKGRGPLTRLSGKNLSLWEKGPSLDVIPAAAVSDTLTGNLFVLDSHADHVVSVDSHTGEVLSRFFLPIVGAGATLALDSAGRRLFVGIHGADKDQIVIMNADSGEILADSPSPVSPGSVALEYSPRQDALLQALDTGFLDILDPVSMTSQPGFPVDLYSPIRDLALDKIASKAYLALDKGVVSLDLREEAEPVLLTDVIVTDLELDPLGEVLLMASDEGLLSMDLNAPGEIIHLLEGKVTKAKLSHTTRTVYTADVESNTITSLQLEGEKLRESVQLSDMSMPLALLLVVETRPQIIAVDSEFAYPGDTVIAQGTGWLPTSSMNLLLFNGSPVEITEISQSTITFVAPEEVTASALVLVSHLGDVRSIQTLLVLQSPDSPIPSPNVASISARATISHDSLHSGGTEYDGGFWVNENETEGYSESVFANKMAIDCVKISAAYGDSASGGAHTVVAKLQRPDGSWYQVFSRSGDQLDPSIDCFHEPILARAFRLEMTGHGWFGASDIQVLSFASTSEEEAP